jgi:valyl-tRNA synthetase
MEGYRNFCNKIWNATRFVLMNCSTMEESELSPTAGPLALHDRWILSELHRTIGKINQDLEAFQFHEAAQSLYHFFWDDFCDWYIELSKTQVTSKEDTPEVQAARQRIISVLETALRMLHPFMPFITEELWQRLPTARTVDTICLAPFPKADATLIDEAAERQIQTIIELIKKVRNIRGELNIMPHQELQVFIRTPQAEARQLLETTNDQIRRLARVRIEFVSSTDGLRHVARDVVAGIEMALPLEGLIDFEKESARLSKTLEKIEKDMEKMNRNLTNPGFLARAAEDVVASTRKQFEELQQQQKRLVEILQDLK